MTVRKRKPLSDKAKLAHYQAQVQLARMKEQEKLRKKQLADQKGATLLGLTERNAEITYEK